MFPVGAFLSYVFVMTFTPGPNNMMSMANGNQYGLRKTLGFNFGVLTGFFLILLLCGYFNLLLFHLLPPIKVIMGVIAAIYMIYLAIQIIHSKEEQDHDPVGEKKENSHRMLSLYVTGLTLQCINPKVIIYGITVMSTFIIPFYKTTFSIILFSLFLALTAFTSTCCWALFGSLFRGFLFQYKKQINVLIGLLLIYSALSISGITALF